MRGATCERIDQQNVPVIDTGTVFPTDKIYDQNTRSCNNNRNIRSFHHILYKIALFIYHGSHVITFVDIIIVTSSKAYIPERFNSNKKVQLMKQ